MTKELKLEECVNLLSGTGFSSQVGPGGSKSHPNYHHPHRRRHSKPTSLLAPTSPYVSANSRGASPPGNIPNNPNLLSPQQGGNKTAAEQLQLSPNSTYAGQSLITSTPKAMIRRNSKNELRGQNQCTIRLLDDAEILQCEFQAHHKGQYIMDFVCRQLNIAEKDYFGLRYVDSNKQRHWLDLSKSIVKQLRDMAYIVCFRFKFYPSDPMLLKEEVSRYQLVLQLRRDILHGRLYSTLSDMAGLSSFIIQSELGDYDPEVHGGNYISDYELVSRQTHDLEEKAIELHQKLKGITPSEADILFLKKAATLDTYGIDPHPVKDQQGEQVYLGINHTGISTFQGSRKSTHFKWSQITKLNYEAKMFIIHLSIPEDSRTKKKETVGFKCQTSSSCKYLWRCAVEQRLFFTCGCAGDIPSSVRGGGIFGTRFRYNGRVQREILEDPGPLRASDSVISRTPLTRSLSRRDKTRSLPHTPLTLGYGSLPRSNHSAPTHESTRLEGAMGNMGSSTSLPLSTLSSPYCPEHTLPLLETLREDSPRVEEKGKGNSGSEQISKNLSTLLEKALDEKVEKEFLSTQEETLTSIPEDPETEAEIIDELPIDENSKSEELHPPVVSVTATSPPSTGEQGRASLARKSSGKKLAVGNGSAILNTDIDDMPNKPVPPSGMDDDNNNNYAEEKKEKKYKQEQKQEKTNKVLIELENQRNFSMKEEKVVNTRKVVISYVDVDVDDKEKENSRPLPVSNDDVPPSDNNNDSAFVPVYNRTDAPEGVCLSPEEKTLRESKIDQVASSSPASAAGSPTGSTPSGALTPHGLSYGKRVSHSHQPPQSALLSVWKVFVVCFICVLIALLLVAILAIEIDIDICQKMRRIPEVEIFQLEVYDPLKRFVADKLRAVVGGVAGEHHMHRRR